MIEGFTIRRGDSYNWKLEFDTGCDPVVPIDISNMSLTFTLKANVDDPDTSALLQVTNTFPDNTDSQNGIGYFFVPHESTVSLIPGSTLFYDFQLSYLDTENRQVVNTLDVGTVKITWDITTKVPT